MSEVEGPRPRRGRPPGPRPPETFLGLIDKGFLRKHRQIRNEKVVRVTALEIICGHVAFERAKGSMRALRLMQKIEKDLKDDPEAARLLLIITPEAAKVL